MRRKAHPHEHQGELNIVPYLDIMVNLVMFMLMSITGFISLNIVNVNLPNIARGPAPDQPPPKDPNEKKFAMTLMMSPKGYYLNVVGGKVSEIPGVIRGDLEAVGSGGPSIPVKNNTEFDYDYDKLRDALAKLKADNPAEAQFTLAPDKNVKYEAIVKTMDEARGDQDKLLFPDVVFAVIRR